MFPTATVGLRKFTVASRFWLGVQAAARLAGWFSLLCLSARLTVAEANEWWAVKPLVQPTVPMLSSVGSGLTPPHNPIDAFVRSALEKRGLVAATEADRRTLIRRLYFDLTGLPPSPEEIRAYLEDTSAN